MSLKAIITTVLLGTSSLAVAAPSYDHVEVRDHRTQQALPPVVVTTPPVAVNAQFAGQARFRPAYRPQRPILQPVTLASAERLNGRDIIKVNESQRAFTKIELRAKTGRTSLDKVLITFGNGQTQTIECNRVLAANESFSMDLTGNQRNLKRVVLVGKSGRRASLDVIAL